MDHRESAIVAQTARVAAWGAARGARRVTGLTREERTAIAEGRTVIIEGCPEYCGETRRRVVKIGRGYYTRMPLK